MNSEFLELVSDIPKISSPLSSVSDAASRHGFRKSVSLFINVNYFRRRIKNFRFQFSRHSILPEISVALLTFLT
jgi:hypothetical protein